MAKKFQKTHDEILYITSNVIFYFIAVVVLWNTFAANDYRFLSEIARKIWAIAGICLYLVILLERHRRNRNREE